MFSKPLAAAALLGAASAFNTVTVTRANNLECGPCILGGFNFCTKKATLSYFSQLSAAYTRGETVTMCCAVGSAACTNSASVVVNNSADWTCYNNPNSPTEAYKYSFAAKSLELAACPFEETICGTKREFSYAAVGGTATVPLTALTKGSVCSYVIKATAGAPNFEVGATTTLTSAHASITWMEYDSSEIKAWQTAGASAGGVTAFPTEVFPINTQQVSFHATCTDCKQGDLLKRSFDTTTSGSTVTADVTAKTILTAFAAQKVVYDDYAKLCSATQKANDAIEEPSFFDALFFVAKEEPATVDKLAADTIKHTWNNTASQGGYGTPTAGYYSLATKGQKPYGAEGQGASLKKNIALDMGVEARFMIVQVLPLNAYTQASANEVFTMTVGAYEWDTTVDLVQPKRVKDCVLKETAGAALTKVSIGALSAALVALSLY